MKITFVNCTEHVVRFYKEQDTSLSEKGSFTLINDNASFEEIRPSGILVRAEREAVQVADFSGIKVNKVKYGFPIVFKEGTQIDFRFEAWKDTADTNTVYIVSLIAANSINDNLKDVRAVCPDQLVRNKDGEVIGCLSLSTIVNIQKE